MNEFPILPADEVLILHLAGYKVISCIIRVNTVNYSIDEIRKITSYSHELYEVM